MWRVLKRLAGPGLLAGMAYNPGNRAAGAIGGVLGAGTTSVAIPMLIGRKLGPAVSNGLASDALYSLGGLLNSPLGLFGGGYIGSKLGAALDRKFGNPLASKTKNIEDWVEDKMHHLVH